MPAPQLKTAAERRFLAALLAVVGLGFLLRVLWLPSQPISEDDYIVGISAINYMENGQLGPTMWNHPVLRNILVFLSLKLFGSGVVGLLGWNVLFGSLCTLLVGLIAFRIGGSARMALVASFLWAMDSLAIDFSRQAINDVYTAFFPLLGIYLAFRFLESRAYGWLLGAGVAFGCGLASKWSALFQIAATLLLLLYHARRNDRSPAGWRLASLSRASALLAALVLLPALVYLLTFIPWFGRGYSLAEWIVLQKSMYLETAHHTRYGKPIVGDYRPREWFVRPVSYDDVFFVAPREGPPEREPTVEDNVAVLLAIPNPLVWLAVLPGVALVAYHGIRRREAGLLYLAALFLFTYLPLALAGRPIWLNVALAVLPYAVMAVAHLLCSVLSSSGTVRKRILVGYLALTTAVALVLYPLAIGKGFRVPYVRDHLLRAYGHHPRPR